jgi:aminopeptidase N
MALAILVRGRRDREARDVRERIELLLTDRDFRVQSAAIEALAVIGDPVSIGPLRRMIDRELDGRLRRRGKEVARDLETGASTGEDVRRMRDEIGELRSVAAALRERIEKLEATNGHGHDGHGHGGKRGARAQDNPGKHNPGKHTARPKDNTADKASGKASGKSKKKRR